MHPSISTIFVVIFALEFATAPTTSSSSPSDVSQPYGEREITETCSCTSARRGRLSFCGITTTSVSPTRPGNNARTLSLTPPAKKRNYFCMAYIWKKKSAKCPEAFHEAIVKGDLKKAQKIWNSATGGTERRNLIRTRGESGKTSLHLAVDYEREEIFRLLMSGGADVDVDAADENLETPLHLAAKKKNFRFARLLLKAYANPNAKDARKRTPLHYGAAGKSADLVTMLVSAGSEVNAPDDFLDTPLHIATRNSFVEVVDLLMCGGAWMNVNNGKRERPLQLVMRSAMENEERRKILSVFLNFGLHLNSYNGGILLPTFWPACSRVKSENECADVDAFILKIVDQHVFGNPDAIPSQNLADLAETYRKFETFALYRVLKAVSKKAFDSRVSVVENDKFTLFDLALSVMIHEGNYLNMIPLELVTDALYLADSYVAWIIEKLAWIHALAAYKLDVHYSAAIGPVVAIAREMRSSLIQTVRRVPSTSIDIHPLEYAETAHQFRSILKTEFKRLFKF